MLEWLACDGYTQTKGLIAVYDFAGANGENCNLDLCNAVISATSKSKYPLHIGGLYFIETPWFFSAIHALLKNFLSKKMQSRVHMLNSREDLGEYIETANLPQEYGGEVTHHQKEWISLCLAQEEDGSLDFLDEVAETVVRRNIGQRETVMEASLDEQMEAAHNAHLW